jgi:transglutaminase-like putative cysteine protease
MKQHTIYPSLSALKWLLVSLILVILPHIGHLAWWISPAFLVLLTWRYYLTQNKKPLPSPTLRFFIAITAVVGVYLSYQTIFGRDAGVSLLIILIGLKLLEMYNLRDALLICFLSYFLIITNFLYSQSIPTALYMSVVMMVITATLISLNDNNQMLNFKQKLKLASTILVQAIPIMLILFILFPRVAGPFWSLPKDSHSGRTGLSDSMTMGNISELSQSDEIAFRVKFDEKDIPPQSKLYWRGPVLWWTDGRKWSALYRHAQISDKRHIAFEREGLPYHYSVTLEPHGKQWLFALDIPEQSPAKISQMTNDYQILAKFPVQQLIRYEMSSYVDYKATSINSRQYQIALRLPEGKHPKSRELAQQWRQQFRDEAQIIQQALQYFNQQPFYYTLNPPLLIDDTVDEFLFETRQGFCEHYAAAFVILMRAAAIPARVVTGYQGGEMNPLGDYLVVRQRDAHAWAEVWLQDEGWIRIDPTAAVSPERVEQGIDTAIPQQYSPLLGVEFGANSGVMQAWKQMQQVWDAMNNGWNQWVLGYGPERQQQLLKMLGFGSMHWKQMVVALVASVGMILLMIALWMYVRPKHQYDEVQKWYLKFCRKIAARYGLKRLPHEGAQDFAQRIAQMDIKNLQQIEKITCLYLEIRYNAQASQLVQFKQAIRQL